ncbi:hypothetical protein [Bifidobacterium sp. UTBIF-78]|uniref:hypothetical protein n=1 Tax=Bifidobacterium sp. UTBIF-78 TaxID=1465263 RepID=UPI00112DD55E|nr:hypothetical protein [Bifidobacterium sp. UTBIF-78]TPF95492.1 hypothetical protein BG22_02220 [Bifidobacterium sp. UTBIF-78]
MTQIYGTSDDAMPAKPLKFADDQELAVGLLFGWCFVNGVQPLRGDEIEDARNRGRVIYRHPLVGPDGEDYAIAFDVTDAQLGATEALVSALGELGLEAAQ